VVQTILVSADQPDDSAGWRKAKTLPAGTVSPGLALVHRLDPLIRHQGTSSTCSVTDESVPPFMFGERFTRSDIRAS
jgi:hypothetical protein